MRAMAIKFEKIQAGQKLASIQRVRMGNVRATRICVYYVQILAVNTKERTAVVSWNGNPAQVWREYRLTRLYREDSPAVTRVKEKW